MADDVAVLEEPVVVEPILQTEQGEPAQVVDPLEVKAEGTPELVAVSWLPEDLRDNERFKDIESPEALARAYAKAELAQALPETYQIPQGTPEQLSGWAKENKLTQGQLDSIILLNQKMAQYNSDVRSNVYAQGRDSLFTSWGEKKAENLQVAENALKAIPSGAKLAQFIKTSGEGANPVVIQALHEFGSFLKEGGYLKNEVVSGKEHKNPLQERYPTMFKTEKEE